MELAHELLYIVFILIKYKFLSLFRGCSFYLLYIDPFPAHPGLCVRDLGGIRSVKGFLPKEAFGFGILCVAQILLHALLQLVLEFFGIIARGGHLLLGYCVFGLLLIFCVIFFFPGLSGRQIELSRLRLLCTVGYVPALYGLLCSVLLILYEILVLGL